MNMAINWEEHLKNDEYFVVNLKLYMYNYHEQTNGISVRSRIVTKTFKKWLKTQSIGDILLKEIEIREKRNMENK